MRPLVPALALVALLAACGSERGSAATTTVRTTTTVATTAVATTSPAVAVTTAAPTTSAVAPADVSTTVTGTHAPTVDALLSLGRPIVLAHTGGEDEFPASTMFAFGESVRAGVDALDLNVQLTADGVLVVHHDDSVDGATNGSGAVADLAFATIHALDDAFWFTAACVCRGRPDADYLYRGVRTGDRPPPPGYTADDFAIPTLRQLIARYPDIPLNVEVKGTGAPAIAAARELLAELDQLGRTAATVVSSFDDDVVSAVRQMAPEVETSPGLAVAAAFVLDGTPLPTGQRILQLPPEFQDIDVLTPAVIDRAHTAGYVIWVWPNNRALENAHSYSKFLAEGIDGLNINFPATGVAAVATTLAATR